ncbi:MAG: hypothetical protein V3T83_11900, partial [Acidobacteriota bacterium]
MSENAGIAGPILFAGSLLRFAWIEYFAIEARPKMARRWDAKTGSSELLTRRNLFDPKGGNFPA